MKDFTIIKTFAAAAFVLLFSLLNANSSKTISVSEDSHIGDGPYANLNYGSSYYLWEDSWAFFPGTQWQTGYNRRPMVKFDFSSIPAGAKIISAKLKLKIFDGSTLNGQDVIRNLDVHRVTKAWKESEVTWKTAKNGNSWSAAGGDFDPAISASSKVQINPFPRWIEWELTDEIQKIIDGEITNEGWLIKDREENSAHQFRFYFYSKEWSDKTCIPQLEIEYKEPVPLNTRGLYVNDFEHILGNKNNEDHLLNYIQCEGFDYLALYGLGYCELGNPVKEKQLRGFIARSRNYGVRQIAAMGETANSYVKHGIHSYNQNTLNSKERIDVYHFEFQFWNQGKIDAHYCADYLNEAALTCNETDAFAYAKEQIEEIYTLTSQLKFTVHTDMFLGWIENYQAAELAQMATDGKVDRFFIAVYRKPSSDHNITLYNYNKQQERLQFLAASQTKLNIVPVFASWESSGNHLGSWLNVYGTLKDAESNYTSGLKAESNNDVNTYISKTGYHWYRYTDMPEANCNNKSLPLIEKSIIADNQINVSIKTMGSDLSIEFLEKTETGENQNPSRAYYVSGITGQLIYQGDLNYNTNMVNLSFRELNTGIYMVTVIENDKSKTEKILINY